MIFQSVVDLTDSIFKKNYVYLAALGLSCSRRSLRSSWLLAGSLAVVCGIWFPDQGWNPGPLPLERGLLAPGPSGLAGKSLPVGFTVRMLSLFGATSVVLLMDTSA